MYVLYTVIDTYIYLYMYVYYTVIDTYIYLYMYVYTVIDTYIYLYMLAYLAEYWESHTAACSATTSFIYM